MSGTESSTTTRTMMSQIEIDALPLTQPSDLDPLLERIGDKQFILIGEASHGTHEYQEVRAQLTRRLINECGEFALIAVEADGPDCVSVDESVRHISSASADPSAALNAQQHWPSWMLSNEETVDFCRWLRDHNSELPTEQHVGWQGLDQYPLWAMTRHIITSLPQDEVNTALDAPLRGEPMVPVDAIPTVAGRLAVALAPANAVDSATQYYGDELRGGRQAANTRSSHWLDMVNRLVEQKPESRAILWAHNTHVGDTQGTDMDFVSIGQLMREHYGADNVALVGTAGGGGTVMAAPERGLAMVKLPVPTPHNGSVETLLSKAKSDEPARSPQSEHPHILALAMNPNTLR